MNTKNKVGRPLGEGMDYASMVKLAQERKALGLNYRELAAKHGIVYITLVKRLEKLNLKAKKARKVTVSRTKRSTTKPTKVTA